MCIKSSSVVSNRERRDGFRIRISAQIRSSCFKSLPVFCSESDKRDTGWDFLWCMTFANYIVPVSKKAKQKHLGGSKQ